MKVFSLDVECIGLYGDVFAVGISILDEKGNEIESLFLRADHNLANGLEDNKKWIEGNVIPTLDKINCNSLKELRDKFWEFYTNSRGEYPDLIIVSDCGSPCEAGFFRECVLDDIQNRQWSAPYPLHELGTLLLARGKDPLAIYSRLSNELPKHNPLADARQSGRLWIENY